MFTISDTRYYDDLAPVGPPSSRHRHHHQRTRRRILQLSSSHQGSLRPGLVLQTPAHVSAASSRCPGTTATIPSETERVVRESCNGLDMSFFEYHLRLQKLSFFLLLYKQTHWSYQHGVFRKCNGYLYNRVGYLITWRRLPSIWRVTLLHGGDYLLVGGEYYYVEAVNLLIGW